jgi:hypothetical protein
VSTEFASVREQPIDADFDFLKTQCFSLVGGAESYAVRHDSECGVSDQLFGSGAGRKPGAPGSRVGKPAKSAGAVAQYTTFFPGGRFSMAGPAPPVARLWPVTR